MSEVERLFQEKQRELQEQARKQKEELKRAALEARTKARAEISRAERERQAELGRLRTAERIEQRKRELPITRPRDIGTKEAMARVEELAERQFGASRQYIEEVRKAETEGEKEIETALAGAEQELGAWKVEALVEERAAEKAEREFKAEHIEVKPGKWYKKDFWEGLTKEQQKEVRETGRYTVQKIIDWAVLTPTERRREIGKGNKPEGWDNFTKKQQDEIIQTGGYTIEGETVSIDWESLSPTERQREIDKGNKPEGWDDLTREQQNESIVTGFYTTTTTVPPADSIEIRPDEWMLNVDFNALDPEDKTLVKQVGVTEFNRRKEAEYNDFVANNTEVAPGLWMANKIDVPEEIMEPGVYGPPRPAYSYSPVEEWNKLPKDIQKEFIKTGEMPEVIEVTKPRGYSEVYNEVFGEKVVMRKKDWEAKNDVQKLEFFLDRQPTASEYMDYKLQQSGIELPWVYKVPIFNIFAEAIGKSSGWVAMQMQERLGADVSQLVAGEPTGIRIARIQDKAKADYEGTYPEAGWIPLSRVGAAYTSLGFPVVEKELIRVKPDVRDYLVSGLSAALWTLHLWVPAALRGMGKSVETVKRKFLPPTAPRPIIKLVRPVSGIKITVPLRFAEGKVFLQKPSIGRVKWEGLSSEFYKPIKLRSPVKVIIGTELQAKGLSKALSRAKIAFERAEVKVKLHMPELETKALIETAKIQAAKQAAIASSKQLTAELGKLKTITQKQIKILERTGTYLERAGRRPGLAGAIRRARIEEWAKPTLAEGTYAGWEPMILRMEKATKELRTLIEGKHEMLPSGEIRTTSVGAEAAAKEAGLLTSERNLRIENVKELRGQLDYAEGLLKQMKEAQARGDPLPTGEIQIEFQKFTGGYLPEGPTPARPYKPLSPEGMKEALAAQARSAEAYYQKLGITPLVPRGEVAIKTTAPVMAKTVEAQLTMPYLLPTVEKAKITATIPELLMRPADFPKMPALTPEPYISPVPVPGVITPEVVPEAYITEVTATATQLRIAQSLGLTESQLVGSAPLTNAQTRMMGKLTGLTSTEITTAARAGVLPKMMTMSEIQPMVTQAVKTSAVAGISPAIAISLMPATRVSEATRTAIQSKVVTAVEQAVKAQVKAQVKAAAKVATRVKTRVKVKPRVKIVTRLIPILPIPLGASAAQKEKWQEKFDEKVKELLLEEGENYISYNIVQDIGGYKLEIVLPVVMEGERLPDERVTARVVAGGEIGETQLGIKQILKGKEEIPTLTEKMLMARGSRPIGRKKRKATLEKPEKPIDLYDEDKLKYRRDRAWLLAEARKKAGYLWNRT